MIGLPAMDETPLEERVFALLQDNDAINANSSWYYNSDAPVMYQDLAQTIAQSTPKKDGRDKKKKPKSEEQMKCHNKTWTETIKDMDIPVGFREVHMVSPPQTRNGKKSSKKNKTADPSIENGPVMHQSRNTYLIEEQQMNDRAPATDVISGQQNIIRVPPKAINLDASPSTAADRVKAARARRYKRPEQSQNSIVSVQDTGDMYEPQPQRPRAPRVDMQTTRAPQIQPPRADCYQPQPPAASPVQPQPRRAHHYKPGSSTSRCVQPQPPTAQRAETQTVRAHHHQPQPPTAPHVESQPPITSRVQPQPPKAPRVHTQPPTAVSEKPHPPTALSVMSQLTTELSMQPQLPTAPHVYLQPPTAMYADVSVQPPGKHGSYP